MQPSSREMQANGGGGANAGQISLDDLHNGSHAVAGGGGGGGGGGGDDFFDQMLCSLPAAWADLGEAGSAHKLFGVGLAGKSPEDPAPPPAASDGMQYEPYDESALLASRLRQHQIGGGGGGGGGMAKQMMLQLNDLNRQHHRHNNVQMMLPTMGRSPAAAGGSGGDGLLLPLTLGNGGSREDIDGSFKSPNPTGGEGLYGGFAGSLQHAAAQAAAQHFQHPRPQQQTTSMPAQNYGATACGAAPPPAATAAATGGVAQPPRQRVRARRGQATDPHSIAERLRRERIAERMKALQELVPNANKTDKATMLDEIIDYVKFLQLQVKVLSMSRLGGAAAVAPLVADMSSEGRGASSGPTGNDSLTVTEHQVAKLMEEDMGSAMQYLQGKGLCLMPISLASAISSATCNLRPPSAAVGGGPAAATAVAALGAHQLNNTGRMPGTANAIATGDGPSSPSMSVLTAQSAMPNGGADGDGSQPKDAASVSKP